MILRLTALSSLDLSKEALYERKSDISEQGKSFKQTF